MDIPLDELGPGFLKDFLTGVTKTLEKWGPPKMLTSSDQPASVSEFLKSAQVRRQFLSNQTVRQQWLAVALSVVQKVSRILTFYFHFFQFFMQRRQEYDNFKLLHTF